MRLRPSVSFLNLPNFCTAASLFLLRSSSSFTPNLETASVNLRISAVFSIKKVRISVIAFCTATAAASESATALVASSSGRTSMPLKYGTSASATFWKASSTVSNLALACLRTASHTTRSRCSRVVSFISSTLPCATFALSSKAMSSVFVGPWALPCTVSKALTTAVNFVCTLLTAASISLMCSSEGCSSPRGVVKISAFSTSTSICFISSVFSWTVCLAFQSFSPCNAAFRCLANSCCAAVKRDCSLDNSAEYAVDSLVLPSFSFAIKTFRVSAQASAATFSHANVCSVAALSLSTSSSG
mmetsp:Transcript_102766/g.257749  ORF Transcript_102766/g.257749 Transcript_102766/m.257749 type:complete len:301 (-) Transcript_102766:2211-3113(-)